MPVHRPEHKRPGVAFGPAQLKAASKGRKPPRKAAVAPSGPVRTAGNRLRKPMADFAGAKVVKGAAKAVAAQSKAHLKWGSTLADLKSGIAKEVAAVREVIYGKEIGKFIDALQKARSGPAFSETGVKGTVKGVKRAVKGKARLIDRTLSFPLGPPRKSPRPAPSLRRGQQNPRAR